MVAGFLTALSGMNLSTLSWHPVSAWFSDTPGAGWIGRSRAGSSFTNGNGPGWRGHLCCSPSRPPALTVIRSCSILLNIPGGPARWQRAGWSSHGPTGIEAGMALAVATLGSFLGGALAWLSLALLAGSHYSFALEIGARVFALGVMALSLISVASSARPCAVPSSLRRTGGSSRTEWAGHGGGPYARALPLASSTSNLAFPSRYLRSASLALPSHLTS